MTLHSVMKENKSSPTGVFHEIKVIKFLILQLAAEVESNSVFFFLRTTSAVIKRLYFPKPHDVKTPN